MSTVETPPPESGLVVLAVLLAAVVLELTYRSLEHLVASRPRRVAVASAASVATYVGVAP